MRMIEAENISIIGDVYSDIYRAFVFESYYHLLLDSHIDWRLLNEQWYPIKQILNDSLEY